MSRAGDEPLVDPLDPGLGSGELNHAPRDHELDPELGAHPFDPGPGRYDDRRAQRTAKRERRERERRQERAARVEPKVEAPPPPPAPRGSAAAEPVPAPPPEPEPVQPAPEPELAEVVPLPRRRPSMAERLERERLQREREERERRARVELERAERERAERERREARRRERVEKLRRERRALRRQGRPARPKPAPRPRAVTRPRPTARRRPGVSGPVRPRRGLLWPTAKAGLAITVVLGLSAALGAAIGLPVPGLNPSSGNAQFANSADLFGVDQGTPTGLASGYVFPLLGPHTFGTKIDRFGAPRGGGIHEGQDILAKPGTPEIAVHDGIVVDRGKVSDPDSGGRGNYLTIYSPQDNHSFVYMHMLKPADVQLGDHVHAGEVVGKVGCTGDCDGPHLHFEVRDGKATIGAKTKPIDPLPFLRQWPQPQG